MKKLNLIERLFMDSHEKQKVRGMRRYAALLLLLLTCVTHAWATYYYVGQKNNAGDWNTFTAMTESDDGLYAYYSASSGAHQFKITDAADWSHSQWTYDKVSAGFNSTNVTEIGDYGSTNAYCWKSAAHYIIVYKPNTVINQSSDPVICASTTKPENTNSNTTLYLKHRWGSTNDKDWGWGSVMSAGASKYEFTYKGDWGEAGCNVNTAASDNSFFIGQTSITNYASFSAGNEVIFTYNMKTNALTITESKYTVTLTNATAASVLAGYKTKPAITASDITGYHFTSWSATGGATITNTGSASTTVAASATGTATANFAANTYTVEYDANDDQYDGTATGSTSSSAHTYDTAKKLTANGFARAGYSFAGWATTPTGSKAYDDQESVTNLTATNGGTVTLYAKWSQEPRATLSVSDDTPNVGQSITFTGGGENCTPTNYQFFVNNVSQQSSATSTYSYTPSSTSTFAVKVTVTHAGGTVTSDVMNITPNTPSVSLVSSSYAETKNTELTLTATPTNVQSGQTYQYYYSTNSGSTWTAIGSSTSSNTCAFTPTTAGTYKFKVVMTYYASTYTGTAGTDAVIRETYTLKLKNSNGWVTNIHVWNTSDTEHPKQTYPGEDLATYGDPHGQWFTYIFDSKYNRCKVNSGDGNGVEFNVTADACMDIGWSGSAWTATSTTCPSEPEVTLTTTVRQNQITLKGQITDYGNDGSSASDMEEVGFYVGATKHTAVCDDGGYFYKTVTGLTANTQYSIYAFATNAGGTGVSATATPTTLATTATHKLKVQVPNGVTPYIFAFSDDDECGSNGLANEEWPGEAATILVDGVSNDWYEFDIHDQYDKFVISSGDDGGEKQTNDLTNPKENFCRWYNNAPDDSHKGDRYGTTDCPVTATSLYYGDKNAAPANHSYETMSGTTTAMSKTLSLAANHDYEFKIVYNAEYYGIASTTVNRDGKTNNVVSAGTSSAGAAYIYLKTDLAGDYTITFNETTKAVSVTYPEAYVMTYSKSIVGTDNSTTSAPSAAYSGPTAVASGDLVLDGTEVTFTAASAGTGYTWKGWYTKADPSADYESDKVSDGSDLTYTVTVSDAAITVYAVYEEDMHTVTVTAGAHGSITTPESPETTVQAGIATTADIVTANADYGYYFSGWTVEEGTAYFGDASAKSTTVRATTDAVIKANYVSHWTIAGGDGADPDEDDDEMGDWNVYKNGIEDFAQDASDDWIGHVAIDLPANMTFYFKVRDLNNSNWYGNTGTMTYGNSSAWDMDKDKGNCTIITAGAGTYTFTWNETKEKLTVTYPDSYTVTYGYGTGGSEVTATVEGDAAALSASGKYAAKDKDVTFTQTPATGYTFAGWYDASSAGTAISSMASDDVYDDIAADISVYAQYTENMTTVTLAHTGNGSVKIGDDVVTSTTAGVATTRTITAVPDEGWYFAGWVVSDGSDCTVASTAGRDDNASSSTTLTGSGAGTTGTVTANFVECDKIYFRNWNAESGEALWENVYVYFNIHYESSCAKSNASSDSIATMTQEGTSNVYWAYIPRQTTVSTRSAHIAFSNHNFGANKMFDSDEAVMRGDYRKGLDMFVPQHSSSYDRNDTKYYNGYWKHHNLAEGLDAGYRIERYTGSGYETPADNGGDRLKFIVGGENTIMYQLRVDNLTSGHNNYMIYSTGEIHYITFDGSPSETGYTVSTSNCSNIAMTEYTSGSPRFYITPTSEGIYTLTIDMSGDVMRLSVNYPVAVGDYLLKLTYNDGTAKKAWSDVIKTSELSSRHYSMYIDNKSAHSPSLVLKKCTSLSAGSPVWSSGTDVSMSGFGTNVTGVFVFDVAISDDAASLSNISAYNGPYYIKTDCATGGWTAYKTNVLEENAVNFDKTDSKTFDYYFCKWIQNARQVWDDEKKNWVDNGGEKTNVKCVIANDYGNAISDTLVGDDILGDYDEGLVTKQYETLPKSASVRFSYNSVTNELKRTYLHGSSNWADHYLLVEGNNISENDATVYMIRSGKTHATYTTTYHDTTLVENNNWIYMLDLEAREKARVRLSAQYDGHTQDLIGTFTTQGIDLAGVSNSNTEEIIGGSTSNKTYNPIRVIYDFKTNNLITAWLATSIAGEGVTKELNANIMVLRDDQDDARTITLGSGSKITNVGKAYSVTHLSKSYLTDGSKSDSERRYYWLSFPYEVRVSQIFGSVGYFGRDWILQRYNGKKRAEKGFWLESETNWEFITDTATTLNAFEGYVLTLDLGEFAAGSTKWDNNVTELYLYFPSTTSINNIEPQTDYDVIFDQTGYECTIDRTKDPVTGKSTGLPASYDRTKRDSYWHLIGIPSFAAYNGAKDASGTTIVWTGTKAGEIAWDTDDLPFLYDWDKATNHLSPTSSASVTFQPMRAYMVQYGGSKMTWSTVVAPKASSVVARRKAKANNSNFVEFNLNLVRDEQNLDHTYVRLTDNEDVTAEFEFGQDLCKEFQNGANIYTLIDELEVAGNSLPLSEQTTIVPVGVKLAADGTYTFSMPEGTEGIGVVLVDNIAGTRTNLGLTDYEVSLTAGKIDNRFWLEISPVRPISTDLEAVTGDGLQVTGARKVLIDNILYIVKEGEVFDARGNRVK